MNGSSWGPASGWGWPAMWAGERGGWWRVPVTLGLLTGGVVSGMLLYTQFNLGFLKERLHQEPDYVQALGSMLGTLIITGLGLLGCLAGIRWIHHQPLAKVFTDGRPFRWAWAGQSAAVWAALWLAFTLPLPGGWAGMVRRLEEMPFSWWLATAVFAALAMFVGRLTEEVVFRGYLLTRLSAWVRRPWLAVGIMAVGFSVVHPGNLAAHVIITFFGIAWGAACIRAGSLAPMIGAHVAHDTLNILLQPRVESPLENAGTTWLEVVTITGALVLWWGWLQWRTRASVALPETNRVAPA